MVNAEGKRTPTEEEETRRASFTHRSRTSLSDVDDDDDDDARADGGDVSPNTGDHRTRPFGVGFPFGDAKRRGREDARERRSEDGVRVVGASVCGYVHFDALWVFLDDDGDDGDDGGIVSQFVCLIVLLACDAVRVWREWTG